ncbi:11492_t:CDS:1, partial [Gigaspora margarita]
HLSKFWNMPMPEIQGCEIYDWILFVEIKQLAMLKLLILTSVL